MGVVWTTGSRDPRRVSELGDDVDDREIVRWSSRFLTGRIWTIVIAITCQGVLGSYPYESDGDGGGPGFLTGWTVEVDVILKWCRRRLLTWGSFNFRGDYDNYQFL